METIIFLLSSSLCFSLLFLIHKVLHKVWWKPLHIQSLMRSQGIKGPSYRLFYGNTKEALKMRKESMRRPMDLSHNIFPRIQPHLYSWMNTYGVSFVSWYGTRPQLFVTDSELVKEILNNRERVFPKVEPGELVKKLLGEGILVAEGEKWAKMRKLANHAFRAESLKNMIPAMTASVEMMLERWKEYEGKEIEVFEQFRLLTSEVISRTAFGSSYLEGKEIFEMLIKLSFILTRNAFKIRLPGLSKFIKSQDDKDSDKLEQAIHDSIIQIVKKREEVISEGVDKFGADFLGLLVKANHDEDEKNRITIDEIVDECKTFYIAGQETTTTLLTWTILLLAIHTDWQEKAREEMLKIFGKQPPNSEGCGRLKLMAMIFNETLRLYPPVIALTRKVEGDIKLGKFSVPSNTSLIIPTLAIHHDPQIWGEDALQFNPERFSEGVAKATNNNQTAFLPFGSGPRICAGMSFAINEAKIALSMILQRYAFTLSPTYVHSPTVVLTVRPQHGVQIKLHAL